MKIPRTMWRKATVWQCTMKGFPAGWLTIEKTEAGLFSWTLVLVDVDGFESKQATQQDFRTCEREALAAWAAAGERLQRARGGE